MTQRSNVCPSGPVPKDRFQLLLAQAWGRIWPQVGKGTMASAMGLDSTKTIDRAVTASNLPEAHTVFNSLCADLSALDELLREYGVGVHLLRNAPANDLLTAAGVVKAMGDLIGRLEDGIRCHNDTLAVAALLRPHMPALEAIIADADRLRGAA
jgi:hypothetical protein